MTASLFGKAAVVASLGLAACTARIEGPDSANGPPGSNATSGGASASGGQGNVTPSAASDPGRVTLHRLNRAEDDNSVRDLFGTSLRPASNFPIDDRGGGFDNIADVLTLSPLHLSVYRSAAIALVQEALGDAQKRAKLVACDLGAQGEACAREVLKGFGYRAWRRPLTDAELERYLTVVRSAAAQGDGYEQGLSLALRAMLMSPHFIFRVELDPEPTSLTPHPVGQYELAARLSYFLWSSTPDAALLASAEAGALSTPEALRDQAARLLKDERSRALVDNFAGQWLHLRALDTVQPDAKLFPDVDAGLLSAMKAESERIFRDIAFQGTPLIQLLTADYTYLNDRLAAHYGLPAVGSTELKRVSLVGNAERGGLLTQGGFLTLTSHPNRTSPVVRGKWVLDELLCAHIPPPPPNVDLGGVANAKEEGLTQRQALEKHRADPTCNSCHRLMDPIGLGLENYDAVGTFRTSDAGAPIDASGQLPTGEDFSGAKQLASLIAQDPEFARCSAKKLYMYALGRAPDDSAQSLDGPTLNSLAEALLANNYSFNELVARIVSSPTFMTRRGEPVQGAMP